jgi:hypothetical protein
MREPVRPLRTGDQLEDRNILRHTLHATREIKLTCEEKVENF